jgi:hypothetical protein
MKNYEIDIKAVSNKIKSGIITLMKNHNVERIELSDCIVSLEECGFTLRLKFDGKRIVDVKDINELSPYTLRSVYEEVYSAIFSDYYQIIKQENIVPKDEASITDCYEDTFYVKYGMKVYTLINDARYCGGHGVTNVACYSPLALSNFGWNDKRLENLKVGEMIKSLSMEGASVLRLF